MGVTGISLESPPAPGSNSAEPTFWGRGKRKNELRRKTHARGSWKGIQKSQFKTQLPQPIWEGGGTNLPSFTLEDTREETNGETQCIHQTGRGRRRRERRTGVKVERGKENCRVGRRPTVTWEPRTKQGGSYSYSQKEKTSDARRSLSQGALHFMEDV